ncbi:DUF4232 domain-containing protein [Streptomyces sp. NBC_00654]|uniref:DUF4232 domain-containing protein n=1 Tax=Streptomyces sp. NBC_00654 TaxID=2975799 RepID=UPI00224F4071|nr:DUF4232 domain-containing protein [Streptomyces sp. NBC_00654]MCX4963973.1 DUF4232 domain-containing protein [Streptomyces sp. NBC_00654]
MRSNRIRTTALAATALLAALSLTACNGEDSAAGSTASTPSAASAGAGADQQAPAKDDSKDGGEETGTGTSTNSGSGSGSGNSAPDAGAPDTKTPTSNSRSTDTSCNASNTKLTLTPVSRPVNHMLLTVTNTGSKNCDAYYYPALRFGEAQSVPPAFEDSKPQAVVTIAPGESAYAGVLTSSADGSGTGGYSTKDLSVSFAGKGGISDGTGAPAVVPLSKSVYVDSTLQVTYWQREMADALDW